MVDKRHNVICVSGGKDSTALLLLALERQAENLQAVFADTGHEHAQTYDYVQYLNEKVFPIRTVKADFSADIQRRRDFLQQIVDGTAVDTRGKKRWTQETAARALEFLHPTGIPFLDLCLVKGMFPTARFRFCSEELKRNPVMEQVLIPLMGGENTIWNWQGVRADESQSRAKLPELDEVGGGLFNYRPILQWKAQDCFDMHRKHGIKHNPLYEQGMGRVGCMPCIHARKDELLEISKRFPEELERVAKWEALVTSVMKDTDVGACLLWKDKGGVGIWNAVEWSKTSRKPGQYDLLRTQTNAPLCSSVYGLCE
jgi:3'-phosphoadenosine 5'-phosphosulfate sulfotransferase (PAPS reductase)/FAD synthetase